MSIFRYIDYREAVSDLIKNSKKSQESWSFSNLAQAARIQKAYVTRVFKKNAHLNTDQLFLVCKYLKLSPEETDFLFLLLEYSRSVVSERKKELLLKIKGIQSMHRDTRKHLKTEMVNTKETDQYNRYYLDPYAPLVHIFLSLPQYASNPLQIVRNLNVTEKRLQQTLNLLERQQIVKWDQSKKAYKLIKDHIQLTAESPFNLPYQIFQRNNAIQKIQNQTHEERFTFSVAFSANSKTKDDIHEEFLKFLKKVEALVKDTSPHEVFQINFDLFGWTC